MAVKTSGKRSAGFVGRVHIYIRQCFYRNRNGCKVLKHVCERGTIFGMQKRGTFSVKNGIYKSKGLDLGD